MLLEVIKTVIITLLVIIILYMLAIMPKLKHNPYGRKLDGWLYAHRGLHNNKSAAPENSLKAFALAVEQGYGIELDVQLTKDNVPVILHDYYLKRPCKVELRAADLTYEELLQYHLFKTKQKIPTLQEALAVVDGKVPLIIELKIPWKADKLCRIVSDILKSYPGVYCIESFNPLGLHWYRRHYPKVVRGQLSTDFLQDKIEGNKFQYFLLKNLLFNFFTKPDFIAYRHNYKTGLSFTICKNLYKVKTAAWTIKTQEEYDENKKDFDLIIFDSFIPEDKEQHNE